MRDTVEVSRRQRGTRWERLLLPERVRKGFREGDTGQVLKEDVVFKNWGEGDG